MKKILPILVIFFSCTDLLINDTEYHSIELKGNGWVQINQGADFLYENNFTLQSWFSGSSSTISDTQTILSMLNPSGEILIGIFKDPMYTNRLDIWIDNEYINTVEVSDELDDIDSFNLVTIKGDTTLTHADNPSLLSIDIFINKTKILSQDTNLSREEIEGVDFIIGGKVNTSHTYRDSFWHGCIDEIRLWNIALADSIIEYHHDYPSKLSFESDSLAYDSYISHLHGLWRFYTIEEAYSIVPNDACSIINNLHNHDKECSSDFLSEAIIYTLEDNEIEFSEKHK